MKNWDKKRPTNFTIDCILSKSGNEEQNKSDRAGQLTHPTLNKVLDNPWISKSPILYSPSAYKKPPSHDSLCYPIPQSINYFNFYPQQNQIQYHQNYYDSLFKSEQNYYCYGYPSPAPSHPSSPSPAPSSVSSFTKLQKLSNSIPNLNVYENRNNCDKFLVNNLINSDKNDKKINSNETFSSDLFEVKNVVTQDDHEIDVKNYSGNVLKCGVCLKVFENLLALSVHEKSHLKQKFECIECGKKFSQLRNYKYHISIHRGTKEFSCTCPECGKEFNDKGYLSSHLKIHRNKKEYLCPNCPKSFNQRVAYNMHLRIHSGIKPHICNECGKSFSRKMLLKQHFRTHSGEKPYSCSSCGKLFADRSNMILHHRLHSGIKPFACTLCPKRFTKKHHLKTHLNYHTGNKPYQCPHPNCGLRFTQSSNMRTHAKKCQYKPKDPD